MNEKDYVMTNNIALFVDVENLVRLAYDNGLPVDLEPVISRLSEHGRVTIRRAYGDLYAACQGNGKSIGEIRKMLQQNFVQFEDIPFINKHKNMADMRLAIEALSLAYSYESITNFAIVSSDKDYMPLISKLRELGKYIIGIGANPDLVNKVYVNSCDEFIYYSTLFSQSGITSDSIVVQFDREGLLDQYLVLLCKALSVLDERGSKTVAAATAPLMKRMKPDFDLSLVGLTNFRELVDIAENRGLIVKEQYGGDLLLRMSATADEFKRMQQSFYEFKGDNLDSAVMAYRKYFENKLKCRIPSKEDREDIYDHTADIIIRTCSKEMPKGLVEISNEVEEAINVLEDRINQQSIFKVLYGLFRQFAFECQLSSKLFNPQIEGILTPREEWDNLFIINCITVLQRDRPHWPMDGKAVSALFNIDEEIARYLIEDVDD